MAFCRRGLTPILHMVSNKGTHGNEVAAIVNKFSDFYALEDLKNHKACFSGYRDAGKDKLIKYYPGLPPK